jgi:hypothetical protein
MKKGEGRKTEYEGERRNEERRRKRSKTKKK